EPGAMRALILPFAVLIVGVVAGMYVSGGILGGAWDVLTMLAEADVAIALNVGGIAALIIAAYYCIHYTKGNPEFKPRTKRRGAVRGAQSMLPAVLILLSACVVADLSSVLGRGEYLASVVESSSMTSVWLIPVLFVVAA